MLIRFHAAPLSFDSAFVWVRFCTALLARYLELVLELALELASELAAACCGKIC